MQTTMLRTTKSTGRIEIAPLTELQRPRPCPVHLPIDWPEAPGEQMPGNLVRTIAQPPPAPHARCPVCRAVIYSRRHQICSVCGELLPEEVRFDEAQARRVQQLFEAERQRHRAWMKKARAW